MKSENKDVCIDNLASSNQPLNQDRNEERFEYYAFISYSHQDTYWAKWLHKKLESFSIPTNIRRQAPYLPRRIRPIFLDKTDLGSGILQENLKRELIDSRYLIVICSRFAAKSEWVNKEIEHFIKIGRTDRIIPFIINGEPNNDDPIQECFPPALRSIQGDVLGLSLQELGKSQALIKIVAALLSVKYDNLWCRHKRAAQQRLAISISILILCLSAIFTYIDGFVLTNIRYYKGYVRQFGVICGRYPINKNEAKKRMNSIRISYRGRWGNPFQLDMIDGAGNPSRVSRIMAIVENTSKTNSIWATTIKLKYTQSGDILDELVLDENGNIFLDFLYIDHNCAAYLESGFVTPQSISGASYVQFARDKQGVETETRFLDQRGLPVKDNKGAFGFRFSYEPDFRSFTTTSIDQKGMPFLNGDGYVSRRFNTNERGDPAMDEYLDYNGKLILTKWNYAAVKFDCDNHGNIVRYLFLDAKGKPITNSDGIRGIEFHCINGIFTGVSYLR
jgi:hypothetical protein